MMEPGSPNTPDNIERIHDPLDIELAFEEVLFNAPEKIEAMEYAEVFSDFADVLDNIEKVAPDDLHTDKVQKLAQTTLKKLWKEFTRDISDRNKLSERLQSKRDEIRKRAVSDFLAAGDEKEEMSEDERKYYRLLKDQKKEAIVAFPNKESEEAFRSKSTEKWMDSIDDEVDEEYAEDFKHMAFIGTLYNTVLPMIYKETEGYVKQMSKGKHVNITSETIHTNITAFLETAVSIAGEHGELSINRDNASRRDNYRRLRRKQKK